MNLELLRRNIGHRVQLEPAAIHLDAIGRELSNRNEDWVIANVNDSEIRLDEAAVMGLTTVIGKDGVHHYTSNPSRSTPGGVQYGLLMLMVQMYVKDGMITYRPCARPGERVPPVPVQIARTAVDGEYLKASGLQALQEAEGWRTAWCRESRLPTLKRQGWELVVESDSHGMPTSFYMPGVPENQVYVRTRQRDLHALANDPYFRQSIGMKGGSVDHAARAISFQFDGPVNAAALMMRINRSPVGLCCTMAPGRVDTVVVHVPE